MANVPHLSWRVFAGRGLLFVDELGEERFFEPIEVKGDGNCLFESLASCGSDALRMSDPVLLREMVSKISLDWHEKKLYGGVVNKLFEVHQSDAELSFPDYVKSKIRSAGPFGSDFDMLLISLVMNVNVRCIFNDSKGLLEQNSREMINELTTSLEDAGIDTSAYNGALAENAADLWIYGHRHGFPMDPEDIESGRLNHFCGLKRTALDANKKLLAYKGALVEDDATPKKKLMSKIPKRAAILKGEKKKQTRRRLTMKEQYDIVQKFEANPKLGHKEVAHEYGIARTTVSTVLKRKDLIKMEIGIALVRDKKYQAKTCRRIFTSDYSSYKAIDCPSAATRACRWSGAKPRSNRSIAPSDRPRRAR